MSVPDQPTIFPYTGNGVTTTFPYGCYLLSADDLVVTVNGAQVTSGFTINGVGSQTGGAVIFSTAPADGVPVVLYRDVAVERQTDYQRNGDLRAGTLNNDFDRLWMALQDFLRNKILSLRYPTVENLDGELPDANARKGMLLGFNLSNGRHMMVPFPTSVGAGDRMPFTLNLGVDFNTGDTTITLPRAPGTKGNLEIFFDGVPQEFGEWDVGGLDVDFTTPIPANVTKIWGYIGTTLSTLIPSDDSVTADSLASSNSALAAIVSKLKFIASGAGAVYRSVMDKLRDQVHVKDYGAVPGGVIPASAAIQAAINSGAGRVKVSGGTYLIDTAIELRDNLIIDCDKDAVFIPAANTMAIFKSTVHAYFCRIHGATIDGNGKTGITAFDLTNFRLQAGLFNCYVTKVAFGAYFRSGCFGAKCDNFTAYYSVPNPITVLENGSVIDITNPCLDNIEGPNNHTGFGIYVTGSGIANEGVGIIGGFIQGFEYGVVDSGNGTRIERTYFEQASLGDIFFNGSIGGCARDTQHSANVGSSAIKMRSSNGVLAWNNKMVSGARTAKYDVDSSNVGCSRFDADIGLGYNLPLGDVTYLPQHSPRSNQSFTPSIAGSTSAGVGTYTGQQGRISLHAGQVDIALSVGWTAHTGTGKMVIKGIPAGFAPQSFNPGSSPPGPLRIAQVVIEGIPYTGPVLNAYFNGNGADISIVQVPAAGTLPQLLDMASTGTVHLKMSYNANA
ncbi:hypothetical protein [Cupriavidus campinensis]|uniref:hypothetical protein n=1 Tax=Cupriavidus campinensis TaxID=151783 RepID=UPI0024E23E6B|nr:hypothetical protein [Cupriavidus campinensis]